MKKTILFAVMILCVLAVNSFPVEFQLNGTIGLYSKDNSLFKELYSSNSKTFGVGMELFFLKFSGFYIDAHYMSEKGESSYFNEPLSYNELHLSAGFKLRFTLIRLSPLNEINFYIKGGGLYLKYAETFEEKITGSGFGGTAGTGLALWLRNFGVGIEAMKNFIASKSITVQGLDIQEKVNFNGLRIVLKGMIRL